MLISINTEKDNSENFLNHGGGGSGWGFNLGEYVAGTGSFPNVLMGQFRCFRGMCVLHFLTIGPFNRVDQG